jgi:hypothetical protein
MFAGKKISGIFAKQKGNKEGTVYQIMASKGRLLPFRKENGNSENHGTDGMVYGVHTIHAQESAYSQYD